MKPYPIYFLTTMLLTLFLTDCSTPPSAPTVAPLQTAASTPSSINPKNASIPDLPLHADWQIQYSGEPDLSLHVDVYNLDLFEVKTQEIASLHARGIYVMCYFSAGSWEDWRPDTQLFPEEVIGKDYEDWPGEKWLDVRDIQALTPAIESRLHIAAVKGCDGVDPDNVNGYENETGFPITYADQLNFNRWLAQTAHAYDLDIGLKNYLGQITDLVEDFDWVLNEECFSYNECELLTPFYKAGKPVFIIEYDLKPTDFCAQAEELGFNIIYKNWELDAYRESCS